MWMYSGLDDTTRIHPEEVDDDTLEKWLSSITGNKDNPRGARRVPPFDHSTFTCAFSSGSTFKGEGFSTRSMVKGGRPVDCPGY